MVYLKLHFIQCITNTNTYVFFLAFVRASYDAVFYAFAFFCDVVAVVSLHVFAFSFAVASCVFSLRKKVRFGSAVLVLLRLLHRDVKVVVS